MSITEATANRLVEMPGYQGWGAYQQFARSVRESLRYVRHPTADDFLTELLGSSGPRKLTIPQGKLYWRARLGSEDEVVGTDSELLYEQACPYGPDGMKPIPNWQTEGRANPRGIPYLYLATTKDTALAEVRPWIGSEISVAQFQVRRDLTIIDCSVHHSSDIFPRVVFDSSMTREDGMWAAIDRAFATPVAKGDEGGDYIPTQIIAEMFNREGFDGIVYKSLLSEDGFNLVLFDPDAANVVTRSLYRATSVAFDFESMMVDYYVSGDAEMNAAAPAPLDDELDVGSGTAR